MSTAGIAYREKGMLKSSVDLKWFNQRVIECQDEAYTLACDLLGEAAAAARVQAAFIEVYHRAGRSPLDGRRFRLLALQCLCELCSDGKSSPAAGPLAAMPVLERQALLLVDMLGLSYAEAGEVLRRPASQVSRLVAQGRRLYTAQMPS